MLKHMVEAWSPDRTLSYNKLHEMKFQFRLIGKFFDTTHPLVKVHTSVHYL